MKKLTISLACLLPVALTTASNAQITRSFAEPIEYRQVAATQPDIVTRLAVKEGASVRAGDIIAELDNSVLRKNLEIAELRAKSVAAIKGAEVNKQIALERLQKLRPMLEKGHANPGEIEKAEAELESTEAELRLAREKKQEFELEVDRIQAEIERNVIRSPIDGVVTEIHCQPGEFISGQERKLATIVCVDRLKVRFYLLDGLTNQLRLNETVLLKVGERRELVPGTIEFVSPVIDPDSGTSRVDVVIDNRQHRLRAGTVCHWHDVGVEQPSLQRPHPELAQ